MMSQRYGSHGSWSQGKVPVGWASGQDLAGFMGGASTVGGVLGVVGVGPALRAQRRQVRNPTEARGEGAPPHTGADLTCACCTCGD